MEGTVINKREISCRLIKMRKIIYFFVFFLFFNSVSAQNDSNPVLVTINGKTISRSDFEYIYNKSCSIAGVEEPSLKDVLKMFVDYKLKVLDAEDMGMDTTFLFKNELAGYRQQVAEEYLPDTIIDNKVAKAQYDSLKIIGVIAPEQSFSSMKQRLIHFYAVRHGGITPGMKAMIDRVRKNDVSLANKSDMDVILYENDNLEKNYPDFANLMREYHDGILLYDISSLKIWNKVFTDTIGLEWYFHKNRKKYKWRVPQVPGKKKKKYPDNYNEVKSLVVADYEIYLDKEWIDNLRKKYKVEINEQVLKTVNDHNND